MCPFNLYWRGSENVPDRTVLCLNERLFLAHRQHSCLIRIQPIAGGSQVPM